MKRNLLFLFIVLLLLTGLYLLVKKPSGSSLSASAKFSVADTGSINKIEIALYVKEERKEVVVLKKERAGFWTVNEHFEAQLAKVNRLLKVIHRLEVKEDLTEAGKKGAMEKMKLNHTRVNISGNSGLMKSYMIGPTNPSQTGNVMLLMGEETPYVMTKPGAQEGYIYLFYSPLYADWRDLGVFAADSITLKSVSVTYPAADSSFTLSRKAPNAPWLVDGMPGSTENIRHYLKGFEGKVNAESLGDTRYPGLLDSLKQKQPDVRLTVENFSGPPVSLILYIRGDDLHNYFGWVDGKNELLTFQEFILGRFLVKKSDLNPH